MMAELKRVIYMGTANIAVPTLEALAAAEDLEVVGVYSQPDRPSGRKRKLTASPVKQRAVELGLPVFTPEKIGTDLETFAGMRADIAVVFAYGQYIPGRIFRQPPLGSINLHPSLLPKYRGASPIQSAIAAGDTETGISVIEVGERMDAGDLLAQVPVTIGPEDTSATMTERFGTIGAELMLATLRRLRADAVTRKPQDEALVTECSKLSKEDGLLHWSWTAEEADWKVRSYVPWPSVYTPLPAGGAGQNLKILRVAVEDAEGEAGEILDLGGDGPLVAMREGAIRLLQVQPPGKPAMDGKAFLNGHRWVVGESLRID